MSLEFDSLNHGRIAFAFFNIETDMILLEHYFLFAQDFCGQICKYAQSSVNQIYESSSDIFFIENNLNVGNLMGAFTELI